MTLTPTLSAGLDYGEVSERIDWLYQLHQPSEPTRTRTRQIMDGGTEAIAALLGDQMADTNDLVPVPPLMHSGLTKLGQKIGGSIPDLKIDPYGYKDSGRARKASEQRERIVDSYDRACRLDMQLSQIGRWLPGYGYGVWIVRDKRTAGGDRIPYAELRDPYEVYPGPWGVDSQPVEMATKMLVGADELIRLYPEHETQIRAALTDPAKRARSTNRLYGANRPRIKPGSRPAGASRAILLPSGAEWRGPGDGYTLAEYWNEQGTWVICPELEIQLAYIPNPITRPRFVVARRFSFNRLTGHYDHIVGLMATMARIQILEYLHLEENVFGEVNIFGESLEGDTYHSGRGGFNRFEQNARVEKLTTNLPYQLFQGVDRMERLMRVGVTYPVTDDAQHPGGGWATGKGLTELQSQVDSEVREYHKILKHAIEELDAVRLEWDETRNAGTRRTVFGFHRDAAYSETFDPSVIQKRYLTRRNYGVMAGWDEPTKIVTGLQLMQAEVIDHQTMQENLDGLENITQVNERIKARKAEDTLWDKLNAKAMQADPMDPSSETRATLALVETVLNPSKFSETLVKYYTEAPPQPSPEQQQMMGAQPPGGPLGFEMPPDGDVTTILSRLEQGGGVAGGAQTVGRMR
jgi:hypothetical protein